MYFLNQTFLEICFSLLITKRPVEISKHTLMNGKFSPSSNLESYLKKLGYLDTVFKVSQSDTPNKTKIVLKEWDKLEKDLRAYITAYREGNLISADNFYDYYTYDQNLFHVKELIENVNKNQKSKIKVINRFLSDEEENKKLKFYEFILELYFKDLKSGIYTKIHKCEFARASNFLFSESLYVYIEFLKTPKQIYDFLYKSKIEKSDFEMKIINEIKNDFEIMQKTLAKKLHSPYGTFRNRMCKEIYPQYNFDGNGNHFTEYKKLIFELMTK